MTESPVDRPLRIVGAFVLSMLFFGTMNMFVKLAAETIPIPQVMFFRNLLGLIPVLGLVIWYKRDLGMLKTRRVSGHFIRSFVGFFSMICFFWSFHLLPLANATAIQFASPLIVTALSVLLLDEKVGPHRWTAVVVGLGAVMFMLQPAGNGDPLGSLIAICAAILAAFAMIAVRKLGSTEHALTIVFYFTSFCILFSGIWMMFVWVDPSWVSWAFLIMVGILGGFGQIGLTYAYARAPAAFVAPFSYLAIIIAAALDFMVWRVTPGWEIWLGSAVVIGSGLYIAFREARKHYTPTAPAVSPEPIMPEQTEKDRDDPV